MLTQMVGGCGHRGMGGIPCQGWGALIREQDGGPDGPEVPPSLGAAALVRGVGSSEAMGLPVQEQWPAGSRRTWKAG